MADIKVLNTLKSGLAKGAPIINSDIVSYNSTTVNAELISLNTSVKARLRFMAGDEIKAEVETLTAASNLNSFYPVFCTKDSTDLVYVNGTIYYYDGTAISEAAGSGSGGGGATVLKDIVLSIIGLETAYEIGATLPTSYTASLTYNNRYLDAINITLDGTKITENFASTITTQTLTATLSNNTEIVHNFIASATNKKTGASVSSDPISIEIYTPVRCGFSTSDDPSTAFDSLTNLKSLSYKFTQTSAVSSYVWWFTNKELNVDGFKYNGIGASVRKVSSITKYINNIAVTYNCYETPLYTDISSIEFVYSA